MSAADAATRQPTTSATFEDPRTIFARCERFLSGHGAVRPKDALAALAAYTGEDVLPDIYGEGEVITSFEREIAGLLGKEAAVFMPSGTMAQQIALRVWADRKGCHTAAFHPTCHLDIHEERGYQALHGLRARLVGNPHGVITLDDLRAVHEPISALLLELPQREIGGQLPEWEDLVAQTAWARERGAAVHMDGARLWESAPYYERSYADVAGLFDTVYVSFYKGVGAIAGAALAGPADIIAEARVWQRRHGGNLIHLYPYVLSARANLERRLARFPHYHMRALGVARILAAIPGVLVKPNPPQTHMMHVYLRGDRERMQAEAVAIAHEEHVALFRSLNPTDLPGVWSFELAVGDAADALSDEEIATYFGRVMSATNG